MIYAQLFQQVPNTNRKSIMFTKYISCNLLVSNFEMRRTYAYQSTEQRNANTYRPKKTINSTRIQIGKCFFQSFNLLNFRVLYSIYTYKEIKI